MSNLSKVIIVAVTAAILIVIVIVYGTQGVHPGTPADNNIPSGTSLTAGSPPQTTLTTSTSTSTIQKTTTTGNAHPSAPTAKPPGATAISFITPVANDGWKIETNNPISWNKEGGITGSLSLIDAATKQFVGVILPQVGPNQTSYTWNTRDLLLDRSNPLAKDVTPGMYEIQLSYDGNNLKPVNSPAFTITN